MDVESVRVCGLFPLIRLCRRGKKEVWDRGKRGGREGVEVGVGNSPSQWETNKQTEMTVQEGRTVCVWQIK